MFRTALALAALTLLCAFVSAGQPPKAQKGIVIELHPPLVSGDINDVTLEKAKPESGIIVSQKEYEKLVKAWGIKRAPKVDFDKQFLLVETSVGSRIDLSLKLDNKGDLKMEWFFTADLRNGVFHYVIHAVNKKGVKTVNGKELPKE